MRSRFVARMGGGRCAPGRSLSGLAPSVRNDCPVSRPASRVSVADTKAPLAALCGAPALLTPRPSGGCFRFVRSAAGLGAVGPCTGQRRGKPPAADGAGVRCPPLPCRARTRPAQARCAVRPRARRLPSSLPQPGLPHGTRPQTSSAPGATGLRPALTSRVPHFLGENNRVCATLEPAAGRTLPAGLGPPWLAGGSGTCGQSASSGLGRGQRRWE